MYRFKGTLQGDHEMIIKSICADNFQSYQTIDFNYNELGLSLVSGPTGAGKSTLMDLAPWLLYGITSKEGAADDVKSWGTFQSTAASGIVTVGDTDLHIFRCRGKASNNDLYWLEGQSSTPIRGKDLTETQKLLEARLGVSSELYLLGSYLTQFSKADSFFIAKAKDRREVLEKIADQDFAVTLGERSSEARKEAKKIKLSLERNLSEAEGKLEGLVESLHGLMSDDSTWQFSKDARLLILRDKLNNYSEERQTRIKDALTKSEAFELKRQKELEKTNLELAALRKPGKDIVYAEAIAAIKREIASLPTEVCTECGASKGHKAKEELQEELSKLTLARIEDRALINTIDTLKSGMATLLKLENNFTAEVNRLRDAPNPYLEQLEQAEAQTNPFGPRIESTLISICQVQDKVQKLSGDLLSINSKVSRLDWLYDKSFELRGMLMGRAVTQIQDSTNAYLEKHFDAAVRVQFTIEGSDKIEVEIYNNGYLSPFRALSGGERCMLKLAFSLSLMRAAQDKAGISFNVLMLDEPLNGLDPDLKAKAFTLLQELAMQYSTVLVIEHDESVKSLFGKTYLVAKNNGYSTITI